MFDIKKVRSNFPMLKNSNLIYLDNAATTFKPQCVIDEVVNYYSSMSVNVHRGDYDLEYQLSQKYDDVRNRVAKFINADFKEIVFTKGASDSLNTVAYGYGMKNLKAGDIILSTEAEHASNILPWFKVCEKTGAIIKYIPLTKQGECTVEAFKSVMSNKVKVVVMANVSNVLGYVQPIAEICKIAHEFGAIVVCDGAQSVPHIPCDVKDWDVDFLAFSAHKLCGPTGVGVLYGRYQLLDDMDPLMMGGGSNARFDMCGNILLKNPPYKFESGTPAIEGVLGMGKAIEFIESVGIDNIYNHEKELKKYAINKLNDLDNIEIYNKESELGIIAFNVKGIFAQDVSSYFNSKNIAVRSGNHCAKILVELLGVSETLRASFYFYNTFEEVDAFINVCKEITIEKCVDLII
ncbi:MAG: aminotransferase class V-fold PLP-dependent enzyme [Anaerorhabdus sp.]